MKKSLAIAAIAQALSISLLLYLSISFFKQLSVLSDYTDRVEKTYQVINRLGQVKSELKDAETSSRGFIITGKAQFAKLLASSRVEFFGAMDSLRLLVKDNDGQMIYLKKAERLGYEILRLQLVNARMKDRMTPDSLVKRMELGLAQMEEMEYFLTKMYNNEMAQLREWQSRKQVYEQRLPRYTRNVFIVTGILTFLFGIWIYLELRKRFRYQSLLQQKYIELRQNNEELEQISFAASHDLQEPLRKIRIFSDKLLIKSRQNEDEESFMIAERINLAAGKMQELINDLVTFNNLVQNQYANTLVNVKTVVLQLLEKQTPLLKDIHAQVHVGELPIVRATETEVATLFQHLILNAIQFRSPKRNLQLSFSCKKIMWDEINGLPSEINSGEYYNVIVKDNGVGFDEAFKAKMFRPFQRLHNNQESSVNRKGMGLAFCKRIMLNSGGWIDADGLIDEGATIHLYFPVI